MTEYVLILVSNKEVCPLHDEDIASLSKYLPNAQAVEWLSEREACLIPFETTEADIAPLHNYIAEKYTELPVDIAIRERAGLRKKLLIADMDSTIIQQECIDEIADFAGLKDKISAITEQAMRGELDFDNALKERVSLLKGLKEDVLDQVISEKIELMPGAKTLIQTMSKHGHYCALVSGGFTFFTQRIGQMVGFHTNQANVLEIENGELTGNVVEPILGREAKLAALKTVLC